MVELLLWALGIAVVANLLSFMIAYCYQSDKLTDITFSLTFILIISVGLIKVDATMPHLIIAGLILLWALRLGFFLLRRVHTLGKDERFDDMRPSLRRFLGFWTMQALTCFVVSLPALILFNDHDATLSPAFIMGVTVAAVGLILETMADHQKHRFKNKHPNKFMQTGLWRRVRHPNYMGEILFWLGVACSALPFDAGFMGLLSPLWISILLIRFSGIPLLREKWQKKYGSQPAFQAYLARSWNLIPYVY